MEKVVTVPVNVGDKVVVLKSSKDRYVLPVAVEVVDIQVILLIRVKDKTTNEEFTVSADDLKGKTYLADYITAAQTALSDAKLVDTVSIDIKDKV